MQLFINFSSDRFIVVFSLPGGITGAWPWPGVNMVQTCPLPRHLHHAEPHVVTGEGQAGVLSAVGLE